MYYMYQYVAVCCTLLCHRLCTKITHFLLMHNIHIQSSQLCENYWCSFCTFIYVFWTILAEGDLNKSQNTSVKKYTAVNFTAYVYVVGCYDTFIISIHGCHTTFWYWVLLYVACWHHSKIFYMERHVIEFQNISISHTNIATILYMEWRVTQFQNISISHMYIDKVYFTWSDMWYSFWSSVYLTWILQQYCTWSDELHCFRTSVYITRILKQNTVHGVTCDTVSEHQYISLVYWNRILYMDWRVLQFQNFSISLMYTETVYCTLSDMWFTFRISVYLTCILKQNIVHGVTRDTVSEHQYISHVYWNSILYMEWNVIQFQNISISHMYL